MQRIIAMLIALIMGAVIAVAASPPANAQQVYREITNCCTCDDAGIGALPVATIEPYSDVLCAVDTRGEPATNCDSRASPPCAWFMSEPKMTSSPSTTNAGPTLVNARRSLKLTD